MMQTQWLKDLNLCSPKRFKKNKIMRSITSCLFKKYVMFIAFIANFKDY